MSNTVAKTILQQLGGSRFTAMTGAYSFTSSGSALSFRIPQAKQKISAVVVTLTPDDLYRVEFFARRPFPECIRKVHQAEGVYFDQLRTVFESETGLATAL